MPLLMRVSGLSKYTNKKDKNKQTYKPSLVLVHTGLDPRGFLSVCLFFLKMKKTTPKEPEGPGTLPGIFPFNLGHAKGQKTGFPSGGYFPTVQCPGGTKNHENRFWKGTDEPGLQNPYYQEQPESSINTGKGTLRSAYRKDTLEFTVKFSSWKTPGNFPSGCKESFESSRSLP